MATSIVSISNLALQKLGAGSIASMDEDSREARVMNACYEPLRDRELRAHAWNFSIKRTTLAPSATTPDFDFTYAFPVPSDMLRLLPPARAGLDWTIEQLNGTPHILTNDGNTLEIRYVAKVTDPAIFDALFVDMLACKMAWHSCETITQSNTKKADIQQEYKDARAEARKINAFEQPVPEESEPPWLTARRTGPGASNFLTFGV